MKHYLVQRIDCWCCERLSINQKYFGISQEEAMNMFKKLTDEFIKETYEDYSEEEIEERYYKDIDETATYFEYCNDDGDNIVIMIEELEAAVECCS